MIEKYPTEAEWCAGAQYKIGHTYLAQGHLEQALEAFQKVVDDYPNTSWTRGATKYIEGVKKRVEAKTKDKDAGRSETDG